MDYNSFFNDLSNLIKFNSVESAPVGDAPYGEEVKASLLCFLEIAERMGFKTINYDNYGGELSYGEGEEIGIIGHLDIVPVGIGWDTDPFTLVEKDGKLYGRGVEDDKGPSLLCLYALKELIDEGVKFNRKIRLIIGCNEETRGTDVKYMKTKTTFPKYGFSPDGNFPLTYSEKGVYVLKLKLPKLKRFSELKGGTVINAVCDYASVKANADAIDVDLINKLGLKLNGDIIESFGIGAHGSTPEEGKNAFYPLFKYMEEMGEDFAFADKLFLDQIGVSNFENEQGKLTVSPDLIVNGEDGLELWCDCRVPAPLNILEIAPIFDKIGVENSYFEKHTPFMVDKHGFLVQSLIKAYNEVTGENASPIPMGGSTYARAFEQGCAFGPAKKGGTGGAHQSNEHMTKEHLFKTYEIYKKAILNLIK